MKFARIGLAASILAAIVPCAHAAIVTKAGSDAELTDGNAWSSGNAPGAGDDATWDTGSLMGNQTLSSAVTWRVMNVTASAPNSALSLSDASGTSTAAINISGTTTTTLDVIKFAFSNSVSISNDLNLTGQTSTSQTSLGSTTKRLQINPSGATLALSNVTSIGGTAAKDVNLWLRGTSNNNVINGTLTVDGQLAKGDSGTWTLNGANSLSWVYITNGGLLAGNNQAFGTGTIYLGSPSGGNGDVTLGSKDGTARSFSNRLDFTSTSSFTNTLKFGGGTGALSFSGTVNLGTAARNIQSDVDTTFSGVISGTAGGINKSGTGILTLSGANSYSGDTTVSAGAITVTGSLSGTKVSVNSGGTFGGTGTVTTTNQAVTFASGAKLDPTGSTFAINTGTANLDLSGALGANNGALLFTLGTSSDKLTLTAGTFTLGTGALDFSDFAFTQGAGFTATSYTLIHANSDISGSLGASQFLSGDLGNGFTGTLSSASGGQDVILTVVPEPGSAFALFGGLSVLLGMRHRRRS